MDIAQCNDKIHDMDDTGDKLQQLAPPGHLTPTIFHQPWWLDIASSGEYREAVAHQGTRVIGRLPYLPQRKLTRQLVLVMPPMTHVLGPAFADDVLGHDFPRSLRRINVARELIAQLPNSSHVWFCLHRGIADTLAFEAAGFATGVTYTIEISAASSEILWRGLRDKTRNVIRRAREQLVFTDQLEPEDFLDFYLENLRAHGRTNNYDVGTCRSLVISARARGAARLLGAKDAKGSLVAAICTLRDWSTEYYFMSTRRPGSPNGAISLLIWEALQQAAIGGLTFDMDGIDERNNLLLLTGFGGQLKSRYVVHKTTPSFRLAQRALDFLHRR